MKELSVEDKKTWEDSITELNDHAAKIVDAMAEANQKIADLNDEIQAYNNVLKNVKDLQTKVIGKMEEYIEGKPEGWDEDEGSDYVEWLEKWQSFDPEPLDLIDDVNVDEARHPNELDELGDSP